MELAHTADWALKVWAPDLAGLFIQAARGMYALMGVVLEESPCTGRSLALTGHDPEDLLVSFLEELLYQAEMHDEAYRSFDLQLEGQQLIAEMCAVPLRQLGKEIKAVTYHGLRIEETAQGLETVIVFDV